MKLEEKEILRKKRILEYAEACGNVLKTCRHFGVSRSNFYIWRAAYRRQGNAGLVRKKPIARSHPNQTPAEVVEKVLYLRQKYHLGPIRIVWYMRRYHDIRISDASVYRVLRRNGLSRLPSKAGTRAVHTKRYEKQVPGHHIQIDVKFLIFKGKGGGVIKRYQYTAIDEATRIRALKVYKPPQPGQCHRLRRTRRREVPLPHPVHPHRPRPRVPGQVPLACRGPRYPARLHQAQKPATQRQG